jgi:hypothetical protein
MPNDFHWGSFKNKILDLISPLLSRKKSGMIQIKGSEVGEIYIEGSSIIHARTGDLTGEEAVLAMMEWNAGRATFDWEAATDEQTVYMPTEQLLTIWINGGGGVVGEDQGTHPVSERCFQDSRQRMSGQQERSGKPMEGAGPLQWDEIGFGHRRRPGMATLRDITDAARHG